MKMAAKNNTKMSNKYYKTITITTVFYSTPYNTGQLQVTIKKLGLNSIKSSKNTQKCSIK